MLVGLFSFELNIVQDRVGRGCYAVVCVARCRAGCLDAAADGPAARHADARHGAPGHADDAAPRHAPGYDGAGSASATSLVRSEFKK